MEAMNLGGFGTLNRLERTLETATRWLSTVCVAISAVMLVVWTLVFGVFIIARSFFNQSWLFIEEFTGYWLILVLFFSVSYALRTGAHIKIELVTKRLGEKARFKVEAVVSLVALFIVGYLIARSGQWFLYGLTDKIRSFSETNTLLWPFFLLVPIGLSVLGLDLLLDFCRRMARLLGG